ncbi:MAG TPA: hypothetical protein VEC57_07780 [Candidatus Limnocylindrales bacterium]|nr:hypothetical protein [Candidatus Limnocylindrales bacterium]
MGLKVFHVFFIGVSALMCLALAVWRASVFSDEGGTIVLMQALACGLAAVGLVVYGVSFLRKARHLSNL